MGEPGGARAPIPVVFWDIGRVRKLNMSCAEERLNAYLEGAAFCDFVSDVLDRYMMGSITREDAIAKIDRVFDGARLPRHGDKIVDIFDE